jgi:hypothetical protein
MAAQVVTSDQLSVTRFQTGIEPERESAATVLLARQPTAYRSRDFWLPPKVHSEQPTAGQEFTEITVQYWS